MTRFLFSDLALGLECGQICDKFSPSDVTHVTLELPRRSILLIKMDEEMLFSTRFAIPNGTTMVRHISNVTETAVCRSANV